MHYIIQRTLFRRRWKVLLLGHLDGDETWVATFKYEHDAQMLCRMRHARDRHP